MPQEIQTLIRDSLIDAKGAMTRANIKALHNGHRQEISKLIIEANEKVQAALDLFDVSHTLNGGTVDLQGIAKSVLGY